MAFSVVRSFNAELRAWRIAAACAAAVFAGGCGRSTGATVSGRITIDGKPAPPGIRIDFQPQVPNSSSSTGYTDAEGRYVMRFNVNVLGVMPGESMVKLSILPDMAANGPAAIPEALREIKLPDSVGMNTALRKTVKPGHNEIDIAVETDAAPR